MKKIGFFKLSKLNIITVIIVCIIGFLSIFSIINYNKYVLNNNYEKEGNNKESNNINNENVNINSKSKEGVIDYVDIDTSNLDITKISLNEITKPVNIYINGLVKVNAFTYNLGNNLNGVCGNTTYKEVINGLEPINNLDVIYLSLNNRELKNPNDFYIFSEDVDVKYTLIKYKKNDFIINDEYIIKDNAKKDDNNEWYIDNISILEKGEYVIKVDVTSTKADNTNYYMSYYIYYINK